MLFTFRIFNNLRLPWKTEFPLKIFAVLIIFFTNKDLWATAFALKTDFPKNSSLYWIYLSHSGVLNNLRLPWKTELPWNFSLFWICTVFPIIQDIWATCSCPEKQSSLKIFTVSHILFTFRVFEQLALALKKQRVPWIHSNEYIFLYYSGFLSNLRLPWKTVALDIFTVLKYFLSFRTFEQPALALTKQSCPENFHCIEYTFYIQDFWATCACPEKQSCPGIFHCFEYVFSIIQDFWATCSCPEKQRVPWIHCTQYVFFIIQEFWATSACPEKQSCPGIFTVLNILFTFRIFEQLSLALKNRVALEFFTVLNMYCISYHSGYLSNLLLPWKTELPWNFSLYWNIFFIIQDFWATSACPENRVCLEIFQAWVRTPPASYAYDYNVLPTILVNFELSQADLKESTICNFHNYTLNLILLVGYCNSH